MKKSLVLAMAMALGVTASAYAANPFSDVPAGHWAYDSISKLAAAGVIEGYGDDTFRGDRLMTRFEMAQIVAKAMAKGANVDKLAAEFADELEKLNVRVAALEKKSDNVKITGQVRWHYASAKGRVNEELGGTNHGHQLRTRLNFNGKINDTWSYFGRLENRSDLKDNVGNEFTAFQQAHLYGRLGGVNVTAGRFNLTRDPEGNIYDDRFDGIQISYGKKIKIGGYYGKAATWRWQTNVGTTAAREGWEKAWGVDLSAELGKNVKLFAGYDKFMDNNAYGVKDNGIFDVGAEARFGDLTVNATYLRSDCDDAQNKNGIIATLRYRGAKATKPGSWGLEAKYYQQGDGTFVAHTMNGDAWAFDMVRFPYTGGGFKGYKLAGYYTLAKNMTAGVEYYDLKGYDNSDYKARTLWTEMQIRF